MGCSDRQSSCNTLIKRDFRFSFSWEFLLVYSVYLIYLISLVDLVFFSLSFFRGFYFALPGDPREVP